MDTEKQAPPRKGLGLRTKLVLGFVALLAILVVLGVESISLLDELGGSIDVILRENYKSVVASERMKEALERMDSGALFALAGQAEQGRELAARNRPRFEAALQTELGNITEPGEGERAEHLRQLYGAYVPVLRRILALEALPEERRTLYFQQLHPTFGQIKGTADEILSLNQQNMVEANDRARELAATAIRHMALLLLAGTAVAGLCVFFLSNAILGPLERLTQAAGQIEKGDLEATVPLVSNDEMGQLAAAFNSMAGGLRELRETDQSRLLRTRRMSQSAIDSLPEAVAVVSPDRQVELANRSAASQFGLFPGEPLPERHVSWLLPLLKRIESGLLPVVGGEAPLRVPVEGHERFFQPYGALLRDGHGHPEGLVMILRNVTDPIRIGEVHARVLAYAARDIERALVPPRSTPKLPTAEERLREVAANLSAMSGLEARRQQLRLEPTSPGEMVDAAVREIADHFRKAQVKLVMEVDPEAPRVLADQERAGLLLPTLLSNALIHTPAGGAVTVRAEPWEGRVRFSVGDTGSGVPTAYRERIFDPIYQATGTLDLGGVGMGLSIARDIVQAHGGEIHCESEEGRGANFWFTLPAAVE